MAQFNPLLWRGFLPPRSILMARTLVATPTKLEPARPEPLSSISEELGDCRRCKLCESKKQIVFGEGNPQARLVFVGQSPEDDEDLQGRPFVGPGGQLLDKMIEAMGLRREEIYLTTIVKCRPPTNRIPEADETALCSPFLARQIASIQPEVIVALGQFATQTLLKTHEGITHLRGRFHPYPAAGNQELSPLIQVMPTFHPSYLLKTPSAKKEVWLDLQEVAKALGISIPKRKS